MKLNISVTNRFYWLSPLESVRYMVIAMHCGSTSHYGGIILN